MLLNYTTWHLLPTPWQSGCSSTPIVRAPKTKAIPSRPSAPWNEVVPKVLIIWFRFLMQQLIPVLRVMIQSTFLLNPALPLVWYAWALQCDRRCFVNRVDGPLSVGEGHRSLLGQIGVIGSLSRQLEGAISLFLIEDVCVLCQVGSILCSKMQKDSV